LTSADRPFDPKEFLATVNGGRTISTYRKDETVFAQGDAADSVFYILQGKVKVTVLSEQGKEAVVAVLGPDEFCGEGCLTGQPRRISTATAMTDCTIMRLEKKTMIGALSDEPAFSEFFVKHLLARTLRVEEDLVDQLFNSSEKRLARALLLLAKLRQGRQARAHHRQGEPRDARRNDRNHTIARELLHEQIPEIGLHRLQRETGSPQLIAQRRPARSTADQKKVKGGRIGC